MCEAIEESGGHFGVPETGGDTVAGIDLMKQRVGLVQVIPDAVVKVATVIIATPIIE
jgi:hypothetical protein